MISVCAHALSDYMLFMLCLLDFAKQNDYSLWLTFHIILWITNDIVIIMVIIIIKYTYSENATLGNYNP